MHIKDFTMKLPGILVSTLAVCMLSGCMHFFSPSEAQVLGRTQAVGSPFTAALAEEYRHLARDARFSFRGGPGSEYFAQKGLAAADGALVMPEAFENSWNVSNEKNAQMAKARIDLIHLLGQGGRDRMPFEAAYAQSRYDCWTAQQKTGFGWGGPTCKEQFMGALESLRSKLSESDTAANATGVAMATNLSETTSNTDTSNAYGGGMADDGAFPPPISASGVHSDQTPIDQAMFIVFFDWNKSSTSASGQDVIDAVAHELSGRRDLRGINIAGHADTSGGTEYNKNLSRERAETVKAALIVRGISPGLLRTEAFGENKLLVNTPDNIREPGNRRAEITLE